MLCAEKRRKNVEGEIKRERERIEQALIPVANIYFPPWRKVIFWHSSWNTHMRMQSKFLMRSGVKSSALLFKKGKRRIEKA